MTPGQEMEQVYSNNPRACTEPKSGQNATLNIVRYHLARSCPVKQNALLQLIGRWRNPWSVNKCNMVLTSFGLVAFSVTNHCFVSVTCLLAFIIPLQISSYFCWSTTVLHK